MLASTLLITSAVLHALWNALVKFDDEARVNTMGVLVVAAVCATIVIPFYAASSFPDSRAYAWMLGAGVAEAGYFVTLALALEHSPLGLAYTVSRGGAMVLVWLISVAFLGEAVGWATFVGVALVLLGLGLSHEQGGRGRQASLSRLKWAYLCACFIAAYHFFYGRALLLGALPAALFAGSLWVGLPIYIAVSPSAIRQRLLAKFVSKPVPMVFGGMVCALSFLIFLNGLAHAGAGFAITLRNTSVVFAQVFGLFIGEKFVGRRWLGALLVVAGAAFIALK